MSLTDASNKRENLASGPTEILGVGFDTSFSPTQSPYSVVNGPTSSQPVPTSARSLDGIQIDGAKVDDCFSW